jgi:hypothetical protein
MRCKATFIVPIVVNVSEKIPLADKLLPSHLPLSVKKRTFAPVN